MTRLRFTSGLFICIALMNVQSCVQCAVPCREDCEARSNRRDIQPERIALPYEFPELRPDELGDVYMRCLLSYCRWKTDDRKRILDAIHFRPDAEFQCMRFICWLEETDARNRETLLAQWFSVELNKGSLPSLDSFLPKMGVLLSEFPIDERKSRLDECERVYRELTDIRAGHASKVLSLEDQSVRETAHVIQPLVDTSELFDLILFSTDTKKIAGSLEECRKRLYGLDIYPEGLPPSICPLSRTVGEALNRLPSKFWEYPVCPSSGD